MTNYDPNKRRRDRERRFLHKFGWRAVEAVKTNGAFKNAWIHPSRKGSYSRQEAVSITKRNAGLAFYTLRGDFFSNVNEESSYWAGFLAADSSVTKTTVSIDLSPKDKEQLIKLKHTLDFKGDIHENKRHVRLQFNSPQVVNDLRCNFGITPRKSLTIGAPGLKNEHNVRAFVRGYLDGDGSIYQRNDGYWCVSFNGTRRMLQWIKRSIRELVDGEAQVGNPSVVRNGSIYKLTFVGEQSLDIMMWLYDRSTVSTRLNRKYRLTNRAGVCV